MHNYRNTSIRANYFRGIEAVGGKLYFYEDSMTFKSHSVNFQQGETKIDYQNISKITKRNTLFICPNGISVFTKDGIEHNFVIYKRNKVIQFLQSNMV